MGLNELESFWETLIEIMDDKEREEIKFLSHSTTLSCQRSITKSGRLIGGNTDLPNGVPLSRFHEINGVWMSPSTAVLPRR